MARFVYPITHTDVTTLGPACQSGLDRFITLRGALFTSAAEVISYGEYSGQTTSDLAWLAYYSVWHPRTHIRPDLPEWYIPTVRSILELLHDHPVQQPMIRMSLTDFNRCLVPPDVYGFVWPDLFASRALQEEGKTPLGLAHNAYLNLLAHLIEYGIAHFRLATEGEGA